MLIESAAQDPASISGPASERSSPRAAPADGAARGAEASVAAVTAAVDAALADAAAAMVGGGGDDAARVPTLVNAARALDRAAWTARRLAEAAAAALAAEHDRGREVLRARDSARVRGL